MTTNILNEPVLVLSRLWLPVATWTVRNAFSHVFADKARIVDAQSGGWETYDFLEWTELSVKDGSPCIHTSHMHIRMPEVVVLVSEGKFTRDKIAFSKRNLLKRDHYTCAYCGRQGTTALTIDHIVPRARGGRSDWKNTVAACFECNSAKADRTPQEAGMRLRIKPHEPTWSPIFKVPSHKYRKSWQGFLSEKTLSR